MRENKERLQNLFIQLGHHLLNALPKNFEHVIVGSFYSNDKHYTQIFYKNKNEEEYIDLLEYIYNQSSFLENEAITEISFILDDIKSECDKVNDCFTIFTYSLECRGNYQVYFSYENIKQINKPFINRWKYDYIM